MNRGHFSNPLDKWNPMEEDYGDPSFNSYVGRNQDQYEMVQKSARNGQQRPLNMGHEVFALHVRGVPLDMTDDGLYNIFEPWGTLLDVIVKVPRDVIGPRYQFGKVYFKSAADAVRALEAVNNKPPLHLNVELDWHSFGDAPRMPEFRRPAMFAGLQEQSDNSEYGNIRRDRAKVMVTLDGSARSVRIPGINPAEPRVVQGASHPEIINATCAICSSKGMSRCSRCKTTVYCSTKCQTADWNTHKKVCIPQTAPENAASRAGQERTRHQDDRHDFPPRQPLLPNPRGGNSFGEPRSRNGNVNQDYKEPNQDYRGQSRDFKKQPSRQPHDYNDRPREFREQQRDFKDRPRQQQGDSRDQSRELGEQPRDFKEQPCQQQRDFKDQPRQQSINFGERRDYKEQPQQGSRDSREQPRPQQSRQNFGKSNDQPKESEEAWDRKDEKRGPSRDGFQHRNPPASQKNKPDSQDRSKSANTDSNVPKQNEAPHKFHPITLGQATKVKAVPTGENPHSFYVQLDSDVDLARVMVKVQSVEADAAPQEVAHSQIVAAKFSDGVWYRARVETMEENKLSVLFIDYGNVDTVTMEMVRLLPSDIANLPLQAVWCRLANVQPTGGMWSNEAITNFQLLIENQQLYASLVRTRGGQSWVTLNNKKKDGDDIGELLIETGCASSAFPVHRSCISDWQVGSKIVLSTPTQEKLGKLWGSQLDGIPAEHLGDIFANLAGACKNISSSVDSEALGVGAVVAAESTSDGSWYRAVILSGQSPSWVVRYIDFGNCEEVTNVQPLPAEFLKISSIAVCLRLEERYAVECVPDAFTPDDIVELKVLRVIGDVAMVSIHIGGEGGPVCPGKASSVWKFDDGFELPTNEPEEELECKSPETNEIPPQPKSTETQPSAPSCNIVCDGMSNLPRTPLPEDQVMVIPTYVDSLTQFRVQIFEEEQVLLLAKLSEELQVAGQNEQLEKLAAAPAIGQLVCGLFSLDGSWYRCLVEGIDSSNDEIKVRFIDFGNTELTKLENLKPLPHEFYNTYPLSLTVSTSVNTSLALETVRKILTPSDADNTVPLTMTIVDKTASPVEVRLTTIDGRLLEEHLSEYALKLKLEDGSAIVQAQIQETEPKPEASTEPNSEIPEVSEPTEAQIEGAVDDLDESEIAQEVDEVPMEAQELEKISQEANECKNKESPVVNTPSLVQLPVGETIELYVGEAEAPNMLYVCRLETEEITKYEKLAEDITACCSAETEEGEFVPKVGEFCFAKSDAFNQWYRAFVSEVEDGKCQVLFADYGNTETVATGNTRKMVDAFREIPLQAIPVVIDGIPQKEYDDVEREKFKEIFPNMDTFSAEVLKFLPEDLCYVIRIPSKVAELKKSGFLTA